MIIQPGARYRVKLNSVAEIGPFKYRPRNVITMDGSLLEQIVAKYGEVIVDHAEQE